MASPRSKRKARVVKRSFSRASVGVLVPLLIFALAASAQSATPFGKIVSSLAGNVTASTADAVFSFASKTAGPPGTKRADVFDVGQRSLRSVGAVTAGRIDANIEDVVYSAGTVAGFYESLNQILPGRDVPERLADGVFDMNQRFIAASRALVTTAAYADAALAESAGQLADEGFVGADTVHAMYASLNETMPGRDVPQRFAHVGRSVAESFASTADTFAASSATINGSTANIFDAIGGAITSAADSVRLFFSSFSSSPPAATTAPSVSVAPTQGAPAGTVSNVTNINTTTSVTQTQLISALRTLLSQGLPADILAQLKGPKGDTGPAGVQGPAGYSIGGIYSTANYANQAGTIGGVTYFGAKEITTDKLTATGATTLSTLDVTGATTLASLTVSGATTLPNLVLTGLDITGNGSISGTFEAGTIKGNVEMEHIGNSTLKTVQDMQNVYHSTGWVSGGEIITGSAGDITVSEGTGLIRNSLTIPGTLATLLFFDWPAAGPITLTDNAENFVYVDYNGGNPTVTVQTTEDTTDYQTRFLLAIVSRVGTDLYVNDTVRPTVGDHAALMIREMQQTMPYSNATGAEITAGTNPLSFNISDGSWWQGLNRFTTPAFDGGTDTFTYYYRNGSGGWTPVAGASQIDNLRYDDGSGTLATLPDNRYGVHWLYMSTDGNVSAVYGSGSYTLNGAQNAAQPDSLPVQLNGVSFIVGKIIIKKNAAALSQIDSVAMMQKQFPGGSVADHNSLLSLQGGTTDEYYHLTATEHDRWASGSASLAIMPDCSDGIASKLLYNPTTGVFTCGVDQSGGGSGGGALEIREFRAGGFDSKSIASISFNANDFDLTASGSNDVTVGLDWVNGPASRTAAQTISGAWHFTAASSQFSNTLEIGTASASSAALGTLTVSGHTTLANASSSGTFEALALRAATIGSDTTLVINPAGAHTFITGTASVSSHLEIGGYASASQLFGVGLSTCSTSERLRWNAATGRFECVNVSDLTGVPFAIREFGSPYINAASASFSASGFNVVDGSNIANISLDYVNGPASRSLANTWTALNVFTAGASVSGNPFEVGANTLYVNPGTNRVGINTQNLSEALELAGNASVSGNLYTFGNIGVGTSNPTSRLEIVGTTSDSTANALAITSADTSSLLTVRNDGVSALGTTPSLNATFAVRSRTFTGAANASTSGSSTTVTTTGNAFAGVVAGATLVANGQAVQVIAKINDNTVITRTAVDWTGGFPFTYTNASFVAADGDANNSAGLRILRQGSPVWNFNSVGAESDRYLYLFNNDAKANILRITEMGTIGLNIPYSAGNTLADPPANIAVYPQAFNAVIGSISGSFYDLTANAESSEDTPTPFTVTPVTDFVYLGMNRQFDSVFMERVTGPTSGVIKAEYWNGVSWVTIGGAMGFTDGTNGFTQSGAFSWTRDSLTGWTTRSVSGSSSYYYVRLSFTSYSPPGALLRINMIVPGTENRFDAFKAPLDANAAFAISGLGRVSLGDSRTNNRVDDSSLNNEGAALHIIDTNGNMRLWSFSASKTAELQLVQGMGSVSDNLHWDVRLASASGPYGAQGLTFRDYVVGGARNDVLTLNNTNLAGTSAVGATLQDTFGAMNGNDLMRGLFLNYTNGSYSGGGNRVRALDIGGITPSAAASESAIVVGPGWDYAFIASQGNVGIGTVTPSTPLEVVGAASVSQFFGAGLTACSNTSNKLQYSVASGLFSCANEQNARIENGDITVLASQNSLDFSANGFNVTASGTTEVLIALDYVNGPASRSIAQTISGAWSFTAASSQFSNTLEIGTASISLLTVSGQTSLVNASGSGTFEAATLRTTTLGSDTNLLAVTANASASRNLEVSGYASASHVFGAGLVSCAGATGKLLWTGGIFSCGTDSGAAGQTIDVNDGVTENAVGSISFSFGQFVVSFANPAAVIHLNWGVGGPASLSMNEVVTGFWRFSNSASITNNLEIGGFSSSSALFGAGLSACSGVGQKLLWSSGVFSCGVDQTGGGGASMGLREGFTGVFASKTSISFEPNAFNLDNSQADSRLSLDYVNGPASRSIPQTITALWTFLAGASVSGTLESTASLKTLTLGSDAGLTIAPTSGLTLISGKASVSTNFEVSGYASVSQFYGAGLTSCTGTFNVIRWNGATGQFSCGTEGGGVRTEEGQSTIVANNNSLSFNANAFNLTASATETLINLDWVNGPASRSIAQTITGAWDFTGGASVTSTPFEVGTNTFYVNPSTNRVGINTQNLSESLEVVGNASISGSVYAADVGIGTTPAAGYRLDVNGSGRFGNGLDATQTLIDFNVSHTLSLLYGQNQFGQAGFDGFRIRNGSAGESSDFTVYASGDSDFIAMSQLNSANSSLIAMNNPNITNLTNATQGLLTNKATTHDIAIQYSFGGAAPIDAILIDTNPTANSINSVIINNGNQNVPFRVAGIGDTNLLYTDGTNKVGIGTNAPLTKLEVEGTASASNLLTIGGLQVAGGSSVSYSRFGTNITDRGLSAINDLLISGKFEVDSQTFLDAAASISSNLEVGGTASISGGLFANGGLTVVGQLTAANASLSGGLELTSALARLGINAGGRTDTMLEVGGTASISGFTLFGASASVSTNFEVGGTASVAGKLSVGNSASISQNIEAAGYASAAAYFGAGLTDCDSLDQRLAWTASGSNAGHFSCKSGSVSVSYVSGDANVPANTLSAMFLFSATNTTAFSIVIAGNNEIKMSTGGYISACSVVSNANVTAGAMKVVGRKNGATMGTNANQYCTMNTTNPRTNSEAIPAGVLTFVAGDTIGVAASANATWAPTTADIMISFTVTFPTGADLAETYYTHNDAVSPATVVTLDNGLFAGVTLASSAYDEKALGVISTAPGLVLGDSSGPGRKVYVALSGRVPVWVSDENGPVKPGDWLTTSSTPGVAMKATRAGRVIGQALTEHSSAGIGQVVMFVKNTQYDGSQTLQQMSSVSSDAHSVLSMLAQPAASSSYSSGILTDRLVAGLDIIAPTVTTHQLSVDVLRSGSDSLSFQELFQQHDELATLVAQMGEQASKSDALHQFVVETNTTLTASDVMLAQSVASQSARVDALNARLTNAELSLAALASASHALTYNNVVLFSGGLKVDSIGSIGDLLTFGSDTYFFGRPYFNDDTAGFAVIRAGTREVRVPFTAPYLEAPVVNASLMTTASQSVDDLLTENVRFAIASVSGDGFTIRLSAEAAADVRLSWIALAVHNARTVFSLIPAEPTATPTPADAPAHVVTPTPETPVASPPATATPDVSPSPAASVSETLTPTPEPTVASTPTSTPSPSPVATPAATPDVVPTSTPEPTATPVILEPSPVESPVATASAAAQ